MLKYMSKVDTPNGIGQLVGRTEDGQVVVVHRRKDLTNPPGPGPCFHIFYSWCADHQVAYLDKCKQCNKEVDDEDRS